MIPIAIVTNAIRLLVPGFMRAKRYAASNAKASCHGL